MAFELNLRIGRNREEKRSLPSEEEKIVEVRDKTAREQPVSVKSPEQAMRLSAAFRVPIFFLVLLLLCRYTSNVKKMPETTR